MPSQLVADVRRMIRDREDTGRPVTALERTFIEAALVPRRNTPDLVDELEAAIAQARTHLLADPRPGTDPTVVDAIRRGTTRRLLAAARAVLDHDPAREEHDPAATLTATLTTDVDVPRPRADIDN